MKPAKKQIEVIEEVSDLIESYKVQMDTLYHNHSREKGVFLVEFADKYIELMNKMKEEKEE